jgi:predicted alpha/beta-fold hydrolase
MLQLDSAHTEIPNAPAQARAKTEILAELARHPFTPPRWLRNAHLQTVAARYGRRVERPEGLRVERWDTPDGDFLDVYRLDGDPGMPTALLLHGLEGSIDSTYFLALIQELHRHRWNVAAMEFRSCSGEMNRAARMYHSGETEDIAFVAMRLIERDPRIQLYVAGYSLGGNVTAKWFGEMSDRLPENIRAGAAISAPYDLPASAEHMDGLRVSRLYVLHFLRKLAPKAIEKDRQHPGIIRAERARRARTFHEFDDHATAPLHGFADAHDYYSSVSCGQFLPRVRRPLLLLSADDDPFNPGRTLPRELAAAHPYLHPLFTHFGGHCGFMHRGPEGLEDWAEQRVVQFFEAYRAHEAARGKS